MSPEFTSGGLKDKVALLKSQQRSNGEALEEKKLNKKNEDLKMNSSKTSSNDSEKSLESKIYSQVGNIGHITEDVKKEFKLKFEE